jgi:hypothetical protein
MSTCSCLHSNTAGSVQLGVIWPSYLQLWSRSERLPPVYLPEELVAISVLQQWLGVDGRCPNMAELTSFFDTGILKLIPWCDKCLSFVGDNVEK